MERQPAQKFQNPVVWQKAHQLVLTVYRLTKAFPKEELFGLTSQMRQAAASVPANLAEGFKRKGKPDKARILNIAQASLEELRYYFILSADLGYMTSGSSLQQADEVARMLSAYARTVATPSRP